MKILINEHKTGMVFLLSLCLLFTFSLVSGAVDTANVDDVFQVNDIITYNKPCINNGTWCSASAKCNYTFYDRDNSIRINNQEATSVGVNGSSVWQYNLTNLDTGLYKVDMICIDGGVQGSETLYYEVTGDGTNSSIGFYILILVLSLGIVILGLSMADPIITLLGSFGLYFVSLYILFNGIAGTKDAITTWGIGLILLGIAMYVSTRSAYELIVD